VGAGFAVSLSLVSTSLRAVIVRWLELPGWMDPVFQLVPLIISAGVFWLLLLLVFTLLPAERIEPRTKAMGSLVGAIALALIIRFATLLIDMFSGSPTAAVFGPVIAIMLTLNVVARIILMVAAWMGTAEERSMFQTIALAGDPDTGAGRAVTGPQRDGTAETVLTFAASAGLIALTLVGFNRFLNTERD